MTFLVNNCNHWISYHIIDELLNNGYEVEGLKNGEKNEHLLMYFGRNSHFSLSENDKTKQYHTVISLNNPLPGVKSKYVHVINPEGHRNEKEGVSFIQAPLLFGEWMPMNEKGMYVNEKFIPFDSEHFLTKSIYIKDFTKAFVQWIRSENKITNLDILSENNRNEWLKLESSTYLRDNRPVKEQLARVIEHYRMYKEMYDCK
ncbi:hypothetical protein [Virgibacillus sp. YIM 98842]|uniref:hypothetical protein n=1 Tax=Virgibacillus sp. YIM 98842 TaxID=2663533 RepID=UPI0013DB86B0|nr:hypothetical protein [Virgibacillus sp. YIM 98842]